jgi:mono/diheme cytochrome c family protein
MSTPSNQDPRLTQSAASDTSLLAAHEKAAGKQADEKGQYKLLPLALLFGFSGLIFWAGTYLNRYSGQFSAKIFDENAHPSTGAEVVAKIDPIVLGKKQFASACIACHQADGKGLTGVNPPLAGSDWVNGSEERLVRIVLHGLKGPVKVLGVEYSAAAMPVFGKVAGSGYSWSDEKIAAVLTYVRQEWGNKSGPISTELVTAVRTKEGDRKEWSAEELLKIQ